MQLLINGKVKSIKKTVVDTGYFYGYGLFETILVRAGVGIFIEAHLQRLNKGLHDIGINKKITVEEVQQSMLLLKCYNGALKINVSEKQTIFSVRTIGYTAEHYEHGAKLKLSSVYRNPSSPLVYLKTMNYMDNILEMRKAKEEGWQDVLFTNYKGEICETAVGNIFFIKEGHVITPKLSSGLLNGIIRQWLMGTTEVIERVVLVDEIETMEGAFMTNSLLGIMKVSAIGNKTFESHDLMQQLTIAYVEQLQSFDE